MAEKPELGLLIAGPSEDMGGEETEAPEDGKLLAVAAFRKALKGGSDQDVLDALLNVVDQLDSDEEEAPEEGGEMPMMPPGPSKPY